MIISTPVTAATTQLHIVKYANDGVTILNETTKTYQWLEANLPVLGDGTTHYYSQGPTFNDSDLWDDTESVNIDTRDWGAVKGTDLENICNLVGGMSAGETVKIKASDGFSKTFPYEYIYTPNSRQGPMVITWHRADQGYVSSYADGMRLVMFANAKKDTYGWNTSGWHVFGNADMRDCWAPTYWYNYSGTYPSSGGVSVKWVSDITIYSNLPPPVAPSAAFISDIQSGPAPLTVQFTDQSIGTAPLSYAWDFNNDGTNDSTLRNPSYTYSRAGTYSVNFTVTNVAGSDSELKTNYITVNPAPIAPPVAAFTGTPLTGTAPLDVTFTDSSTGTSITNRRWDFGDGTITNYVAATNPSHRYSSAGTYSVNLTVTNAGGSRSLLRTNYVTVTPITSPVTIRIGVTNGQMWYLDANGNGIWDAGTDMVYNFGAYGWTPVIGDWNGDTTSTKIGIYKNGMWYLDNDGSGTWNAGDRANNFGAYGWTPVIGDWNGDAAGTKIGIYKDGAWYLDNDGSGTWNQGDRATMFGIAGWTPVIGDWNPDVKGTKIGIYKDGAWYLDNDGSGTWNAEDRANSFGATGWTPVVGGWNPAVSSTKIGVYKDGTWYLDWNGNGVWDNEIDKAYSFGAYGWSPVLGEWNPAIPGTKIGVYMDGTWYLDWNGNGVWDSGTDKTYMFGSAGWSPIIGKWS